MGALSKLFGFFGKTKEPSVCDFCDARVSADDDSKIALIKGDEPLAEFERKTGRRHLRPASRKAPADGAPLFFACPTCLALYLGRCMMCKQEAGNLTVVTLRGETSGEEVDVPVCPSCIRKMTGLAG